MNLPPEAIDGLQDLYLFLVYYCGLDLEEQPHREMTDAIQKTEDDPEDTPYALEVVPRGTYKTSIGRGAVVWKQLRQVFLFDNPYHRIALASATLALGETSLRVIEGLLRYGGRERRLIKDFGELWMYDKKNNVSSRHPDGIILAPRLRAGEIASVAEPSFWVGSERRISTGFHADGALIDDLNNRENVQTAERREKIKNYWRLFFPILEPRDRAKRRSTIIFNSTPWHDDDVRGMVVRQEKERHESDPKYKSPYVILHRSAYNEDGTALFPTKLSLDVLERLREEMGATQFSANYLCDPVGENGFVHEDEIIFKPRAEFQTPLSWLRATVDTNSHFEARGLGCYAAIMVSAYDRFAHLYFLDARGSREWDTAQLIEQLFKLNEDYNDIPILIEDAHLAHFDHAIRLEMASRGVHLRINYVPTQGESKYNKWEKLQPRFRTRRVTFAEEIDIKLKAEIKEELVRGQSARFKDFLDAMAMAELGVRPKILKDGTLQDRTSQLAKKPDAGKATGTALTFGDMIPGWKKYMEQ